MEGYQVATLEDVVETADIFITATGNKDVITADAHGADEAPGDRRQHRPLRQRDRHGRPRRKLPGVERINIKPQVDEWRFPDGHSIIVLSEGRLLNLGNATGHPSFVMSNSFTNQMIAQIELFTKNDEYEKQVYVLPKHLDEKVARLHLDALGVQADRADARAGRLHRRARSRARTSPTTTATRPSDIADSGLAAAPAQARIEWADGQMPVLRSIRERFAAERPLDGRPVARLPARDGGDRRTWSRALSAGGAEVALCASNPLSTQDDVAAALWRRRRRGPRRARRGRRRLGRRTSPRVVARAPQVTLDDGADLVSLLHAAPSRPARAGARRHRGDDHRPRCACARWRPRAARGAGHRRQRGAWPSACSTTASARASRRSTASCAPRTCCWPGRPSSCSATAGPAAGVALRARGAGASVIVCEVDPLRGAGGAHGGLRGDAGAGGGRARRRVHHRDRGARRAARARTSRA